MLTDTKIKKIKPSKKITKITDSLGLYLEVRTTGTKIFRFRYQHPQTKKRQTYTIGEYPAIGLKQARDLRDKAKELLAVGIDPNEHKKTVQANQIEQVREEQRQANRMTFAQLFELWHSHNSESWAYTHSHGIRKRVEKHVIPCLGAMPMDEVKPMDVIKILKQVEDGGRVETTRRIKQYISRIFKFGIGLGHCERNPASELPDDIFQKAIKKNYAHTTDPKVLTQVLRAIEGYAGDVSTQKALELAPYVFLRSKELAGIRWEEIDLEKGIIEISAERMKKKRAHIVPITSKVLEIIEHMRPLSSECEYLFPSPRSQSRPLGEQTLNPALHRLGFKGIQTLHGFRHSASTMLNEMGFMGDLIEKQLAHEESNKVRGTYNKAQYLPQRKEMMQAWTNYLDGLKSGADIVPFRKVAS